MKILEAFKLLGFGKKSTPPQYPRWPKRGEIEDWMCGKVAHFRAYYPDQACNLFDISCADYLPIAVHVAGNFGSDELAVYRRIKAKNPDLVEQARRSTGHRWSRARIHDPEDCPDEEMFP
jgi:hypothetical protein